MLLLFASLGDWHLTAGTVVAIWFGDRSGNEWREEGFKEVELKGTWWLTVAGWTRLVDLSVTNIPGSRL